MASLKLLGGGSTSSGLVGCVLGPTVVSPCRADLPRSRVLDAFVIEKGDQTCLIKLFKVVT